MTSIASSFHGRFNIQFTQSDNLNKLQPTTALQDSLWVVRQG